MSDHTNGNQLLQLGWREWVHLPDLGLGWIKAKIDSGARTSALHAFEIEPFVRDGREFVRFKVHPQQHSEELTIAAEAELIGQRHVRSSHGKRTLRPVIRTTLHIMDRQLQIELTLVCRKRMKFRMLIGREALRDQFVIDAARSYLGGKRPRRKHPSRHGPEAAPG